MDSIEHLSVEGGFIIIAEYFISKTIPMAIGVDFMYRASLTYRGRFKFVYCSSQTYRDRFYVHLFPITTTGVDICTCDPCSL